MIDIILTLFKEVAQSKKLVFFLVIMIVTTFYGYGKKFYLNYYKTKIDMAKFVSVNCNGSIHFDNKFFQINITPAIKNKAIPHCIFNRSKWKNYENLVLNWMVKNGGFTNYIYTIQINQNNRFTNFGKRYGDVYNPFNEKNKLSDAIIANL